MSRPLPIRLPSPRHTTRKNRDKKVADLESIARLVEDLIPTFKKREEQQFYREVVQSCRTAARNIRQNSFSDDHERKGKTGTNERGSMGEPKSMKG